MFRGSGQQPSDCPTCSAAGISSGRDGGILRWAKYLRFRCPTRASCNVHKPKKNQLTKGGGSNVHAKGRALSQSA